jgi:hypothetical protein
MSTHVNLSKLAYAYVEFQLGSAQRELEVYIQDKEQTKNKWKETTGKIM